jgi:periplasmic protein TonB
MKRKNEKFPEFDEIIFANRNKSYGAYDLRKRYKSAANISILGSIAFCSTLLTVISFTTEEGTASSGPKSVIIEISNPIIPDIVQTPELKPPPELIKALKNLQPVITSDTSQITSEIPITDEILDKIRDGNVNDTVVFEEPTDQILPPETKPFIYVEEMPQYPGGDMALMKFISENISYPAEAQNNNIQGRVILKFVVNIDGSVDRIEVLRSVDPSLDNEAVRVIQSLPKFKPGRQGGVPVPVWFSLPVIFRIENN